MAVAVLPTSLTPDVLHGGHSRDVPKEVYEQYVTPLLKQFGKLSTQDTASIPFDPSKHLLFTDDYYNKTKKLTLEELAVTEPHQEPISNVGVSEAFPLFTDEAIAIMRWEMFQKDCFLSCARRSRKTADDGELDMNLRGFAKEYAPFTYKAWTHPKVMEIINKMAGVELEHMYDYEIAHSNISVKQKTTKVLDLDAEYENPDEIPAVVSWHFDSPQFVCVLMMSETDQMVGGETSLMTGDGKVAKVENPKKGWANVLQGRILKHVAPKPKGEFTERVTQVCSYRPKNSMLDNCTMTTTKPSVSAGSRYNEFYKDWMNYRLNVLTERIKVLKEKVNSDIDKGELFNQVETINFIQGNIVEYAEHTWQEFEVVDDGVVEKPASYKVVQARWD